METNFKQRMDMCKTYMQGHKKRFIQNFIRSFKLIPETPQLHTFVWDCSSLCSGAP